MKTRHRHQSNNTGSKFKDYMLISLHDLHTFHEYKLLDPLKIAFFIFSNHVLQISDGIETMGGVRLELFGYLVLAWVLVYLVIWKGLQNSGKVLN